MRRPHTTGFLVLICVLGCKDVGPETPVVLPRADLEVAKVKVQVGEPIVTRMVVLHPEDLRPTPEFDMDEGGLTLLKESRTGAESLPGSLARSVFTYHLAAYVPGPVEIGPMKARLEGRDEPLSTQTVVVEILNPLAPETQIDLSSLRPPKGPVPVARVYLRRLVIYGIAGLAALLSVAAAALFILLGKGRHEQPAIEPSPEERALRRLEAVAEAIPAAEDLQPLYYEMNLVLRRYIEERFNLRAARQTTEEFLQDAKDRLPDTLQQGLRGYLSHCDFVKYARLPADRGETEEAVARASRFVVQAGQIVERQKRLEAAKHAQRPVPRDAAPVGGR